MDSVAAAVALGCQDADADLRYAQRLSQHHTARASASRVISLRATTGSASSSAPQVGAWELAALGTRVLMRTGGKTRLNSVGVGRTCLKRAGRGDQTRMARNRATAARYGQHAAVAASRAALAMAEWRLAQRHRAG